MPKKLLTGLIASVISFFLLTSGVQAQCQNVPEPRRAIIEHNGIVGIWFRMEVARCILQDLSELRLRRQQVELLENRIALLEKTLKIKDSILQQEREGREHLLKEMENTILDSVDRPFWQSPLFGFSIGVLATSTIFVAAILLTK